MDLTVVIPARNVADTLPEQLDALLAQEWDGDWEIVVVNNGSTDATAEIVGRYAATNARVRLVPATAAAGIGYARDTGIAAARSDQVAICDGDDVVFPGWVRVMGEALQVHDCVTGPMELDRLNPPWLAESRGRSGATGLPSFHGLFPVFRGGNFGLRRPTWEKVGGFDNSIRGCEDVEYSLRLGLADIEIVNVGSAVVSYRYQQGSRDLFRQGWTYGRDRPLIARRTEGAGLGHAPRAPGLRSWAWLVIHLPGLRTREGRALWCWVAGSRLGHLWGSLIHRRILV